MKILSTTAMALSIMTVLSAAQAANDEVIPPTWSGYQQSQIEPAHWRGGWGWGGWRWHHRWHPWYRGYYWHPHRWHRWHYGW